MSGKRKKLLILGIAVVVVAIVVANLTMTTSDATMVDADRATKREVVEKVSASGRVQPQSKVDITSEVNGEIIGLFVREGDRVQAGQRLIQLDTVEYAAEVRQARFRLEEIESRVAGAKTTLEQAEEEFEHRTEAEDEVGDEQQQAEAQGDPLRPAPLHERHQKEGQRDAEEGKA